MGKLKKIGIGFGILIAIIFVIGIIAGLGLNEREESLKKPELSPAQIKSMAFTGVTYDDLMRNNEDYIGKIVHYQGKVLQMQNVYGDTYALRVGITEKTFFYEDVVWTNYAGPRVLENDIVEFWGTVKGLREYTAVLGNTITVPEVDALILDVVKKQE